jgi:hypothetical protein
LRDDTTLDFTVGLVTLGGDRVDFVDEDYCGRVLLGFLKGLAQVGFGFTGHLGHDFGTVDQEEESASLVGNSSGHESLTGTGRTVHEDTTRRLDTDRLEELGMSQRQLDKLTDLSHLLANTTNVVVADLVEVTLLVLALDGLTFAVDDGVLCDDAKLWGIHLDNLELDLSHATSACEEITLANGSVGLAEVGSEEDVEERASDTLNCVGDREDCDTLGL